jgi:hypothetical protein
LQSRGWEAVLVPVVRAAIINAGGATDFCARFLNEDGKPITNIAASLSR